MRSVRLHRDPRWRIWLCYKHEMVKTLRHPIPTLTPTHSATFILPFHVVNMPLKSIYSFFLIVKKMRSFNVLGLSFLVDIQVFRKVIYLC